MSDTMREAFEAWVCDVWRPDDGAILLHKEYPRMALAAWKAAAQSQPAPPVPSSVQEIMRLMMPYISACEAYAAVPDKLLDGGAADSVAAAFKPLQAALTALVDDNHRLKFEMAGVRGTAETEPKCETCGGRGQVTQSERVGKSDFNEWDIDCPVCDGAGHANGALQKHVASLNARIDKLQREAYDWWAAANASSGVNTMRKPLTDEQIGLLSTTRIFSGMHPDYLRDCVREIEKAHGIEPEQGGNHE